MEIFKAQVLISTPVSPLGMANPDCTSLATGNGEKHACIWTPDFCASALACNLYRQCFWWDSLRMHACEPLTSPLPRLQPISPILLARHSRSAFIASANGRTIHVSACIVIRNGGSPFTANGSDSFHVKQIPFVNTFETDPVT